MKTTTTNEISEEREHKSRVCTKCGHENAPKTDTCAACGSHLYLVCRQCHHRNPRALFVCEECGGKLKKSRTQKFRKWLGKSDRKTRPIEIIIALVMVFVFYRFVMVMINFFTAVNDTGP